MTKPGPGKFQANDSLEVSEALYNITLDGEYDDELGSTEDYGAWYGLILNEEFMHLDTADCTCNDKFLTEAAYIVEEDTQGFFTYKVYASEKEAKDAWDNLRAKYDLWEQESDITNENLYRTRLTDG